MIAIIDYGVGNLFSLCSSLKMLGLEAEVTADPKKIKGADRIILPGVGAFGDAIEKLRATGLVEPLTEELQKGKPLLGICLGMQLLFEKSFEYGEHDGLGYLKGKICNLADDIQTGLKVPEMGWNSLHFIKKEHPLLRYIQEGDYVYYVHSYYAKNCAESLVAVSDYEVEVPGIVGYKNVMGTQFHPEKSGAVGLSILKAFSEIQ